MTNCLNRIGQMIINTVLEQKTTIKNIILCLMIIGFSMLFRPDISGSQENQSVDINGYWKAAKTQDSPLFHFQFTVIQNRLSGSVWVDKQGKVKIIEGSIQGNNVNFSSLRQVVEQYPQYDRTTHKWSRPITKDLKYQYEGKITKKGIQFIRKNERGYYAKFLAIKTIDKTRQLPADQKDYKMLYSLPGHTGGVNSLNFGPEDSRCINGGLRLASGGAKDGLVKQWNLATGKSYDEKNFRNSIPPDGAAVQVMYSRIRKGNGRYDLVANAVSTFRFLIGLKHIAIGGSSGGSIHLDGTTGIMTYSPNSSRLAISEIMDNGTTKLYIRSRDGNIIHVFTNCERITALAFDSNTKYLAVAETSDGKDNILKLIDVNDGGQLWKINIPVVLDTLAFQPNVNMLFASGKSHHAICIYRVNDGLQTETLPNKGGKGVDKMTFSHDGNFLSVCSSGYNLITIWHTGSTFILEEILDTSKPVDVIALNHDGSLMATGNHRSDTISIWGKTLKK